MSAINELYQEMIIDHGRRPRNFGASTNATTVLEGFNPLCGDRLTLYLTEKDGKVENITFQGNGCAISMASASLMTEAVKGKTVSAATEIFSAFHQMIIENKAPADILGKLSVLAGVAEFPSRVKCATLAWHTLMGALSHETKMISTEEENNNGNS
jgi:nitrogen fixation NifU-like protein